MPAEPELAFGGEGAYATAGDYMRFLRALLRGGELDGARILKPETVDLMFTDHLGRHPTAGGHGVRHARAHQLGPALPFGRDGDCGLHLLLEDVPDMRRAGSGDWAGLFNCVLLGGPTRPASPPRSSPSCCPSSTSTWSRHCCSVELGVYAEVEAPTPA